MCNQRTDAVLSWAAQRAISVSLNFTGLKEVLERWGLSHLASGVAGRWKCTIAPHAANDAEVLEMATVGVPTTCDTRHAKRVYDLVGASDPSAGGLSYLQKGPWAKFARPKIALKGGWVSATPCHQNPSIDLGL
jgi:hypothetical protein